MVVANDVHKAQMLLSVAGFGEGGRVAPVNCHCPVVEAQL